MAKQLVVKCWLIGVQMTSLLVALAVIGVHYNPWIRILIQEPTGDRLAQEFRSIEGEEVVVFVMSTATALASAVGASGVCLARRTPCLLTFYATSLTIFLFVTFVALCGTLWHLCLKVLQSPALEPTSWPYIFKSLLFVVTSAAVYATGIRLTRRLVDDDYWDDTDDDSGRHLDIDDDKELTRV